MFEIIIELFNFIIFSILEASIKITNEPPTGMQANLHKALDNFDQVCIFYYFTSNYWKHPYRYKNRVFFKKGGGALKYSFYLFRTPLKCVPKKQNSKVFFFRFAIFMLWWQKDGNLEHRST